MWKILTSKANFNLKYFLPSFSREKEQSEKINCGQKENLYVPTSSTLKDHEKMKTNFSISNAEANTFAHFF